MKSILRAVSLTGILLLASACETTDTPRFHHDVESGPTPWSHENFDAPSGELTFAVFSDLTGGERPGVFAAAAGQLARLRPELVMNVGDLIEGDSQDPAQLARQWDSFDERAAVIPTPVFRVGGNHDLSGRVRRDVWAERYGPHYYHFVYEDVLFLVLDTEDFTSSRLSGLIGRATAAIRSLTGDGDEDGQLNEPGPRSGNIGPAQVAYFRSALARHDDVRWTMIFMHRPVWEDDYDPDFVELEAELDDRPYIVFSGHHHSWAHATRHGRDYFMLGTTGGFRIPDDPMSFDHVTLVTMGGDAPSIVHLRLEDLLAAEQTEVPGPAPAGR